MGVSMTIVISSLMGSPVCVHGKLPVVALVQENAKPDGFLATTSRRIASGSIANSTRTRWEVKKKRFKKPRRSA